MSHIKRHIPGTMQVEGREFLFVEVRSNEVFTELVDKIFASCPTVSPPRSGGILEEKAWITLQDNTLLLGVSYKGDLQGWRKKIQGFCKESGRMFGIPSSDKLLLADGTSVALSDCKVVLER
jgi:hypothetical protein